MWLHETVPVAELEELELEELLDEELELEELLDEELELEELMLYFEQGLVRQDSHSSNPLNIPPASVHAN